MASRDVGRRLLREAAAARAYLIVTVLLGLAAAGLILAQAGLLAHALATAVPIGAGPGGTTAAALAGTAHAAAGGLGGTLALLLAVLLARAAAIYCGEVTALRAAAAVKAQLRARLISHVLDLGPAWLARRRAGEITTLATGGLDALDPYFARYLPQLVLAIAVPLAVLVRVTAADWISGLIIALTLPLIPVFAVLVGVHTKAQTQRQWQLLARLSGHFLDVVQGLPTLKVFGRAKAQEQVISRVTGEYRASVMATLRVAFLSALVLELSAALATALVAVEVGIRLLYGHIGYPTALLVLLLTPEAFAPLRAAAAQFHASAEGAEAAGRVFEILDTPVTAIARPPGQSISPDLRTEPIMLNGVTVAYPGRDAPVLRLASLTIEPGDRITVTGPNGSGKTTLLNLLLRFIEPASGSVQVGGADLAAIPTAAWRSQIAWLPQHPWLFPWSVAENIALGAPRAPRPAIERAAALAGAAEFIEALPDGYDTQLDERALRLSAGQRQKIALARLFLRDAPLVLLDEPTAHLDPASAAEVDRAISTLTAGRTVILITHRDGATRGPGRMLVVRDGSLTETEAATSAPGPGAGPADLAPAPSCRGPARADLGAAEKDSPLVPASPASAPELDAR